jgi:hypothetical protein
MDAVSADWPDDSDAVMRADEQIAVLGELMRILVVDGHAHLATAASWIAEPDDALDGLSPAAWLAAGRTPDRLRTLCRQGAGRLSR